MLLVVEPGAPHSSHLVPAAYAEYSRLITEGWRYNYSKLLFAYLPHSGPRSFSVAPRPERSLVSTSESFPHPRLVLTTFKIV
jgi:hypothetical protein